MKKVDTTNAVQGVRKMGATPATFDHIIESILETTDAIIRGVAADPTGVVALYGCVNSGSGLNFNISAGKCWYNNEIFEVDALLATAPGGQTAVLSINTIWRSGDPIPYSDGSNQFTHSNRKLVWSFAVSGSGIADYSSVVRLKDRLNSNLLDVPGQISTSAASTLASANAYSDSLVVGLWDDRGSYSTAGGAYPSSGGSGIAGAIKKGDIWTISVAGSLPGQVLEVGDTIRALIDSPGNSSSNWAAQQNNIGYVPVDSARQVIAGAGLSGGGDMTANRTLDVNVDNSTIEINADTLRVKDGGITAAKLASNALSGTWLTAGISYASGVTSQSGNPLQYKNDGGIIKIRGGITTSGKSNTDTLFTLPVGFRPSKDYKFKIFESVYSEVNTFERRVFILTTGVVSISEPGDTIPVLLSNSSYCFDLPYME